MPSYTDIQYNRLVGGWVSISSIGFDLNQMYPATLQLLCMKEKLSVNVLHIFRQKYICWIGQFQGFA